jgi:phage tail-like protein
MQIETREDGGGGSTVYQLPGRFKYTNLHVTRPIGPDTAKTMRWLQTMLNGINPSTAQLAALDPSGEPVFAWTLLGVIPAKWTGPSFDVENPSQAKETLELAYTSILLGAAQ